MQVEIWVEARTRPNSSLLEPTKTCIIPIVMMPPKAYETTHRGKGGVSITFLEYEIDVEY